jgi:hypothetical protein
VKSTSSTNDRAQQDAATPIPGTVVPPVPGVPVFRRDQTKGPYKLVVAVHGMGDQTRNEMAHTVAQLFARHYARHNKSFVQATMLPLGCWDAGLACPISDDAIGFVPRNQKSALGKFAFAEVSWADIPRRLEAEGHRLEESTQWADGVVERFCQRHQLAGGPIAHGPQMAAAAIEEIAETVRILRRLLSVAEAAGVFKFDLGEVLEKYLCDVQQVTEFKAQRTAILLRFLKRMEHLATHVCPHGDIHVIAHSEGSVVALFGLLTALKPAGHVVGINFDWIERVKSFTTIGSPIDKHLILWPEMWHRFSHGSSWRPLDEKIRWSNYYDYADPVGFELDTARLQLDAWGCKAFDFPEQRDHGFRRSPLPGKAHVDYLADDGVFAHIIEHAVGNAAPGHTPRVRNRALGILSPVIPFAAVILLHLAAVFVFHMALVGSEHDSSGRGSMVGILGCSMLLLGTTVIARVQRLPQSWSARALWTTFFVACAVVFSLWPGDYTMEVAKSFGSDDLAAMVGMRVGAGQTVMIGLSLFVIAIAKVADWIQLSNGHRPIWGLRWMMLYGGAPLISALVIPRLLDADLNGAPLTLGLSALAFLYLWWLGVLVFDLSYYWQRYINRESSFLSRLRPLVGAADRKIATDDDGSGLSDG